MKWYHSERADNLEVVKQYLSNYLTACKALNYEKDLATREMLKAKIKEVDDLIDNKLINAIGKMIETEYKKGVSHDYSYVHSRGKTVMYVENTPYCSSTALTPKLEAELEVKDTRKHNVDGKQLDYIIDEAKAVFKDYCTMSETEFFSKYNPPSKLNGSDNFVRILVDEHNIYPTSINHYSLKYVSAEVKNIEDLNFSISKFVGESGVYSVQVKDGKMILEDCFQVDSISCRAVFERDEIEEKFRLAEFNLHLYNEYSKSYLTVRTAVSDSLAIAYGEVIDSEVKRIEKETGYIENIKKIEEMLRKKQAEREKKQKSERED